MSFESEWRSFLNEDISEKNIFTYIQGLQELISKFKEKTGCPIIVNTSFNQIFPTIDINI